MRVPVQLSACVAAGFCVAASSMAACSPDDSAPSAGERGGVDAAAARDGAGSPDNAASPDRSQPGVAITLPEGDASTTETAIGLADTGSGADASSSGSEGAAPMGDASVEAAPPDDGDIAELAICVRLQAPADLARLVAESYELKLLRDCRVNWISRRYLCADQRLQFETQLINWSYALWGCATSPPTGFGLVYGQVSITAAESDAVIDSYVASANTTLQMSPNEVAQMRQVLHRLAEPFIVPGDDEFPRESCGTDAPLTCGDGAEAGGDAARGDASDDGAATGEPTESGDAPPIDGDAAPSEAE